MKRDLSVPRHVAIVMDGNGRWAKKRYLPRFFGHKAGVDALVKVINACADRGVEYLTVFAFSSENWKRPEDEVSGLMGLVLVAVTKYLAKLARDGVKIVIVGDRNAVSDRLRAAWQEAEEATVHNTRITLSVAFNYGGRWDVVQACRHAMADGLQPEQITEATLSGYMAHAPCALTPTCSSAPVARCASATSCCGRWPTRNWCSPTACGPTSMCTRSTPRWPRMPHANAASVPSHLRHNELPTG